MVSITHSFRRGRERDGVPSTLFLWWVACPFSRHAIELEGVISFCVWCGTVGAGGVTRAAGGWVFVFGDGSFGWPDSEGLYPEAWGRKVVRLGWVTEASAAEAASFLCLGGTLRLRSGGS